MFLKNFHGCLTQLTNKSCEHESFSLLVLLSATFQVLPNGNILDCLSSMRKDNTGLLWLSLSCSTFSSPVSGLFIPGRG